jgi:hypothetical protein
MNVKELIAELQKCNPKATVLYNNMELFEVEGFDGKASDDVLIDLLSEPNVPVAQAKSIIIY